MPLSTDRSVGLYAGPSSPMTEVQAVLAGVPTRALAAWQALHLPGTRSLCLDEASAMITGLLNLGVPVNLLDASGQTLLGRLTDLRPLPQALMSTLIRHGASFDLPVPAGRLKGLSTPIWEFLMRNAQPDAELARLLLDRGLSPHAQVMGNTKTPLGLLDLAILGTKSALIGRPRRATIPEDVQDRLVATLDVLLDRGACVDGAEAGTAGPLNDVVSSNDRRDRSSPLRRSLSGRSMLRVAQHLVDRGARLDGWGRFTIATHRDPNGTTAFSEDRGPLLHQVAASSTLDAVRWLIEAQHQDPDARTALGATVLQVVQQRHQAPPDLVAYLEGRALRATVAAPAPLNTPPRARL